jgi:putative phage-type endonuclease
MLIHKFEQRSQQWYDVRLGKITSTSISNVLGDINLKKTKQAIENLAINLAIEEMHKVCENDFVTTDMQRGIDHEPMAYTLVESYLSEQFIELEKIGFIEYSKHIGCSPDAKASNNYNVEIKCPSVKKFFKLTLTKEIDNDYYAQMQHQMMCGSFDATYFVNYLIYNGQEYSLIMVVDRDEKQIDLIKERCEIVIEKKLKYIETLKSNGNIILIN